MKGDHSSSAPKPKFKGFLSRSRSVEHTHIHNNEDTSGPDGFSPNPTIEASSTEHEPATPTKKSWERHYKAFLTKKKSPDRNSPSPVSALDRDPPKSPSTRKSGFSLIPGSKRLLTRTPASPKSPRAGVLSSALPQHVASLGPLPTRTIEGGRAESMPSLKQPPSSDEREGGSIRGGRLFQNMFSRSTSANANLSSRGKTKSMDELDDTLRRGVEKSYSPHTKNPRSSPHHVPPPPTNLPEFPKFPPSQGIVEKDDAGLDSLLASADSATSIPDMVRQRSGSHSQSHQLYNVTEGLVQEPPESIGQFYQMSHNPSHQGPLGLDLDSAESETGHAAARHTNSSLMKKAFTEFHNASEYAPDAASPFLGDDPSTTMRHDRYIAYNNNWMNGVAGSSVPHYALSERGPKQPLSTSLPLEPVDEGNISIHKGLRLLKPIEGTSAWQEGRRYLISPAALAQCPLSVVSKLSGSEVMNASAAASRSSGFGIIDLGKVLATYVGEKHHLSKGKWSSCRLVLRQNILLEYDMDTPITGLPRGFVHLQYAVAYAHADFADALELQFFASPCAKADQRVLMIRASNREERDDLVTCLNDAATLRIEDLWDYDVHHEFGSGRYAKVVPARRKNGAHSSEISERSASSDGTILRKEYDCALKVVDKNKFWRRVVKGRERADTLVREVSVQSTLSAKCWNVPSFLKIKGFFETSDNIVMELELLEGTDLFDYISKKGVAEEVEAARITRDILTSLEAMNRVGLAHRDIKPANILMCNESREGVKVKLCDFGMSTFVGVDGLVRGRCGTPGYVAPEILSSDAKNGYGNKIDVFSAGVTLYVMLCGYEPFYGESEEELIEANKASELEFPGAEWANVSQDAKDLLRRMTAKDPKDRLGAKDALEHPWIKRCSSKERQYSIDGAPQEHLSISDGSDNGICTLS